MRASWRESEFAALDFETTGLDPVRDEVISVGAVPVVGGRVRLGEALYRTIRPGTRPSPRSVQVHQLRWQDLDEAPPIASVAPALSHVLEGRYLLVWVAAIEIAFLRKAFGGSNRWWRRRTVDVADLARFDASIESGVLRAGGLAGAVRSYGLPVETAHHALNDAVMTAELFILLATRLVGAGMDRTGDLLSSRVRRDVEARRLWAPDS